MIGNGAFDYVHPDDLERVEMAFAEGLMDPTRRPSVEYRFRHKDGSWVWLESLGTNRLGDPGVGEYVVTSRNITVRKQAETRLREAEERYRTLVERVPAVVYVRESGEPSRTTYVSPQTEAVLGYSPEERLADPDHWVRITHPEDRQRVLEEDRRTNDSGDAFATEYRQFAKDGSVVWLRDEATLVRGAGGEPLYWLGVQMDITERKRMEERLHRQALHDSLTGLPNRELFVDRLGQALRRTWREDKQVAVLFMDLDGFKVVNDSLGHEAGDLLLTVVAQRLGRCVRPQDTLARFGGDEFVVLVEDVDEPAAAIRVAERIAEELRRPFILGGRELYAPASIGVSWGDARTKSSEDLLRDADTAMYQAKRDGSGYRVFDPDMYERVVRRLELENDLRRAVEAGEFVVHYQPIFDFGSQEPWGAEALLRWDHPERGPLCPDEFVPLAEETGLIVPLGAWVLEEACRQTKEWQDSHPRNPPLGVIVNLSAKQLRHPGCEQTIKQALARSGLAAGSLSLDVTESAFIEAVEANAQALERIQVLGVRISIDDFGMGYSSLSYLKRLPADALKIDKSFVKGFGKVAEDTAIVRMVIDVAHTLNLEVVAEGVETWAQAALLEETGCDMAQGFHFAEPLPPGAASQFLTSTS
jgi:diguanylate cyclase (GGDEF)-like protein/PAS domain S-box-containing protein